MVIGFLAAAALAVAADDDEDDVLLLLLLLLLQAASASAAAANAAAAALRRRHRVAGIDGTAKLLCARSLGGGLAVRPVGRVPARSTGFFMRQKACAVKRTNVRNTVS
jgi:hypothetical protein